MDLVGFGFWIYLGFYILCPNVYALNLNKVKIYFLEGNYQSAISEGENILANSDNQPAHSDELYYLLGLSYLESGNYLRSCDIFEIILEEFKKSSFGEEARLGLGDAYFLQGDYDRAEDCYKELISRKSDTKFGALVYYRLSQAAFKKGNTQQARAYLDKLQERFPLSFEAKMYKDASFGQDIYYTVQAGSFMSQANARGLYNRLIDKGYDAYIEEALKDGKKIYRVKVGRLKLRSEAAQLENKLLSDGYSTKILP